MRKKPCCGKPISDMIKRNRVKSCCGRSNLILEIPRPIRRHHVTAFEGAGYIAPKSHQDIGIFYIRGKGIAATAPFGARRITIYCSGRACDTNLSDFEKVLEAAIA